VTVESDGQELKAKEEIIAEKFAHLRGQRINAYTVHKIQSLS
jgi:hypothetical protein